MSKSWAKEDKVAWNKSEVFKEYENNISQNIIRVSIIQEKINEIERNKKLEKNAQDKLNSALEKAKTLNSELEKAKNTSQQIGLSDDHESDKKEQENNLMFNQENKYIEDSDDWEESDVSDHIVKDLRSMAQEAIGEGNIKLAYKIERTIQEILDGE
jgi:hypothetical protein